MIVCAAPLPRDDRRVLELRPTEERVGHRNGLVGRHRALAELHLLGGKGIRQSGELLGLEPFLSRGEDQEIGASKVERASRRLSRWSPPKAPSRNRSRIPGGTCEARVCDQLADAVSCGAVKA